MNTRVLIPVGTLLALFLASARVHGQVQQSWVATYKFPGASDFVFAPAIATDAGGGIYVAATSTASTTTNQALIKYAANGSQLWVSATPGLTALAVGLDSVSNVYVTGYSTGSGTEEDYRTQRYNAAGTRLWSARYDGPDHRYDSPARLAVDNAGNVIIAGASYALASGFDFVTVKYATNGAVLWVARYNDSAGSHDIAAAVAVDGGGNAYVTGSSRLDGSASHFVTVKYDPNGNQVWVARYDGTGFAENDPADLAVDSLGNVYVTGSSAGSYATVKYDSNGNPLWASRDAGAGSIQNRPARLKVDALGNAVVTGFTRSAFSEFDYLTVKYDASGQLLWRARYNFAGADEPAGLALDASGNAYVTGASGYDLPNGPESATVKYDANGNQVWAIRYNGPGGGSDQAHAIVLDGLANVYVTGASSGTSNVVTTIKYVQTSVAGLPAILSPPQSQLALVGEEVSIVVTASGNEPLRYQWRHDGLELAGATNAMLLLTNVQVANEGDYSVIVSNAIGRTVSPEARLTVGDPPNLLSQSSSQTAFDGDFVFFSVSAMGYPAPSYQWFFNDQPLPTETRDVLNLADVKPAHIGDYTVVASNAFGMATSAGMHLSVISLPPFITNQPASQTVFAEDNAMFTVGFDGHPAPAVQWRRNNSDLPGERSRFLTLYQVTTNVAGDYTVVLSNYLGSVTSQVATLTVIEQAPVILVQPASRSVFQGHDVTFAVVAQAAPRPQYQWLFNGQPLAGQTAPELFLYGVNSSEAGAYRVVVSNYLGSVTSVDATLTVHSVERQSLTSFGPPDLTGVNPLATVIQGSDGMLYGTTRSGGSNFYYGTVFRLRTDGTGFRVLHHFGGPDGDGQNPSAPLLEGSDGMLYGTTTSGGTNLYSGTVFKLNKDGSGYRVLHDFLFFFPGLDGLQPQAALVEGADGALYGTTRLGGISVFNGTNGTVFGLNKDGSNYRVLHSFELFDGQYPEKALAKGSDGVLYGTTRSGSSNAYYGTVFRLNADGTDYRVLHHFTYAEGDGFGPGALLFGRDGVLYGVTRSSAGNSEGVVFKLNTDGSGYRVLHIFTLFGNEGWQPESLVEGNDGALYGTTRYHGPNFGFGSAVFRLNKDGSDFDVLFSLDGAAQLSKGHDGIFYGTTESGGDLNYGTVFRFLPPQTPHLLGLTVSGNAARVSFTGWSGYNYQILRSTDLRNWNILNTITMPPAGTYTNVDTTPLAPAAYYRAAWIP